MEGPIGGRVISAREARAPRKLTNARSYEQCWHLSTKIAGEKMTVPPRFLIVSSPPWTFSRVSKSVKEKINYLDQASGKY
jgi:hypothetical protein